MEMRVVPSDEASVAALTERLRVAVGSECVSVNGNAREVDIQVERETDQSVLDVLGAVWRWYEQVGVRSVEMWLGERSYTFARWVPVETWP